MGDISHSFGNDIDLSASGDFLYVSGTPMAQQRIVKRILTVAGSYLWHLTYGAGAGQFVGQPTNTAAITNAIRSQIFAEESVAQLPEPNITLQKQQDGVVICTINYTDSETGQPQTLSLNIGN